MTRFTVEFSLYAEVTDAQALYDAAHARCIADGVEAPDDLLRPGGEIDAARCIQMILDPGTLAGCEIIESTCEAAS